MIVMGLEQASVSILARSKKWDRAHPARFIPFLSALSRFMRPAEKKLWPRLDFCFPLPIVSPALEQRPVFTGRRRGF